MCNEKALKEIEEGNYNFIEKMAVGDIKFQRISNNKRRKLAVEWGVWSDHWIEYSEKF